MQIVGLRVNEFSQKGREALTQSHDHITQRCPLSHLDCRFSDPTQPPREAKELHDVLIHWLTNHCRRP